MTRDMWLGLARHILTVVGGYFVAKGSIDSSTADTIIVASVALGGAAWSVAEKKKR